MDSFPTSTKPVKLKEAALVSFLQGKAKEMQENEWLQFPPCVPLSIVISALNRDQGSIVRDTLNHFHVKGDHLALYMLR